MKCRLMSLSLDLRPIEKGDIDALHRMWTDPPVRRSLWDDEIIPREETREIVETSELLFEKDDFGIWGVRNSGSEELIGFAGFWYFRSVPALELLFGVASRHWGRGIATEASRLVLAHGFDGLGFELVNASTDAANLASIRVMEKLGMTFRETALVEDLQTTFYQMRRDQWQTRS